MSDIRDFTCTFSGTQYKSIEFDPHYGWNLKLRRSVFLLSQVQYFESLVTDIISVLKPQGPLAETDFFRSLATSISIKETVGDNTPIITCKAKRIYWGASKVLASVWLIGLCITIFILIFHAGKNKNPEDLILGLLLCTIVLFASIGVNIKITVYSAAASNNIY